MHSTQYKKFALAALFTFGLTFALLWSYSFYGQSLFMDGEYMLWKSKKNMVEEQDCCAGKILILGDSLPQMGLSTDILPENYLNLASGGQTTIDMYFMAEAIQRQKTLPKKVVITFNRQDMYITQSYWLRTTRFASPSFRELEYVRRAELQNNDSAYYQSQSVFQTWDNILKNLLTAAHFPSFYVNAMSRIWEGRAAKNRALDQQVRKSRGYLPTSKTVWEKTPEPFPLALETNFPEFIPNPIQDLYFDRLLMLLNSMNIPIVYMEMPITPETNAAIKPKYRQQYQEYITQKLARYSNVIFAGNMFPLMDHQYFSDPVHLLKPGAEAWSRIAYSLIEQANLPHGMTH